MLNSKKNTFRLYCLIGIVWLFGSSPVALSSEQLTKPEKLIWENLIIGNDTLKLNIPFDSITVAHVTDSIITSGQDSGYCFTALRILEIVESGNVVTLKTSLSRGPKLSIPKLSFEGLTYTDPEFLRKFIEVDSKSLVTPKAVTDLEWQASQIGFIDFIAPVEVTPKASYSEIGIKLRFNEKKRFRIRGLAGYTPSDNNDLIWNLDMKLRNLFGQGREVGLNSARQNADRNHLEINYWQPLIFIGPGHIGFKVATRDYRDQFYEFVAGAEFGFSASRRLKTINNFEWKNVEPSGKESGYRRLMIGGSMAYQRLDNSFNPQNGYSFKWTLSYANRRYQIALPENDRRVFNDTRTEFSIRLYKKLVAPIVNHLALNYHGLETTEALPPLAELYLIGGPGSLRSFRSQQFSAIRTAFGTVEQRLNFNGGYGFLFWDAAYLNNRQKIGNIVETNESFENGYGFGIALLNKNRQILISLGWNKSVPIDQPRLSIELSSEI